MRHHLFVSCRSVTACCSGAFKPTLLMMRKNHNNNEAPDPGNTAAGGWSKGGVNGESTGPVMGGGDFWDSGPMRPLQQEYHPNHERGGDYDRKGHRHLEDAAREEGFHPDYARGLLLGRKAFYGQRGAKYPSEEGTKSRPGSSNKGSTYEALYPMYAACAKVKEVSALRKFQWRSCSIE